MIINSDTFLVLVDAVVDSSLLKFHFSEVTLISLGVPSPNSNADFLGLQ